MKIRFSLAAIVACLCSVSANAQQPSWNDAQMEVWKLIEQSWVDDVAENGKWPADYVHEYYTSWGDGDAAPSDKDSAIAWSRFGDENNDTLMYEVSPEAITVVGGTAVAHYNVTTVTENSKGERNRSVGRITEVLIRVGGSWKWLAGVDYEPKLND